MRIIAGELKGRKIDAPRWPGLRPTSDKLRETLFNVLASRVAGARVLDAYAGTGAIGIEAISRGASSVTFVDDDVRALKLIESNLRRCGVSDRYAIIRTRLARRSIALPSGSFDLAVLDPPYDEPDLPAAIAAIAPLLTPGGLLVLEHAKRRPPPAAVGAFTMTRNLTSGDSALAFYSRTVTSDE
jgi:16S rRNA (guanine966-N2)-methyltransferase